MPHKKNPTKSAKARMKSASRNGASKKSHRGHSMSTSKPKGKSRGKSKY